MSDRLPETRHLFVDVQRRYFSILGENEVRRCLDSDRWDDSEKNAAREWLEARAERRSEPRPDAPRRSYRLALLWAAVITAVALTTLVARLAYALD